MDRTIRGGEGERQKFKKCKEKNWRELKTEEVGKRKRGGGGAEGI